MVNIKFTPENRLNEEEKLSLLKDRMYLVFYPNTEDKESFSVAAYDTTPANSDVHPTFYVLKGIMSLLETDMERIVSLGQMAVMDNMIDLEKKGEKATSEDLAEDIEKVKFGKPN